MTDTNKTFDEQYVILNPSTDEKKFKLGGIINVNTGATKEMFYELDLNDDEKKETGKYYSISGVKLLTINPNMFTRVKKIFSLPNNNQNEGGQNGGKSKKNKKNGKKSNKKLRKTIKIRL